MKKFIIGLCTIIMTLSMVSCSDSSSTTESKTDSSTIESSSVDSSEYVSSAIPKSIDKIPSIVKPDDLKENSDGWVYYGIPMTQLESIKDKDDIKLIFEYSKYDDITTRVFEAYNVKTDTYAYSVSKGNSAKIDYIMYVTTDNKVDFKDYSLDELNKIM